MYTVTVTISDEAYEDLVGALEDLRDEQYDISWDADHYTKEA